MDYKIPDELKKLAEELKLKDHQRKFCESCFSLPDHNITEAYCQAYGIKPERRNYARTQATHVLNDKAKSGTAKHNMQQYYKALQEYFKKLEDAESGKRIMDSKEWMMLCSDIARGNVKDQFNLDASLADRLKAMDMLGKAHGLFKDKLEVSGTLAIGDAFAAAEARAKKRMEEEKEAQADESEADAG